MTFMVAMATTQLHSPGATPFVAELVLISAQLQAAPPMSSHAA